MRCDACGTENEPGSRFCGNCGAKVRAPGSRVAPTVKVTDQPGQPGMQQSLQALAQQSPPSRPPAPMPLQTPRHAPPSMPPANATATPAAPTPVIPRPAAPAAPAPKPAPLIAAASSSLPSTPVRTGRRWGLVAVLLVIDLGLAGAGAFLLQRGLAARDVSSLSAKAPK